MNRSLFLVLLLLFTLAACRKSSSKPADEKGVIYNEDPTVKDEDKIFGVWLKHHLGSTPAPGDTLHFTQKNGTYNLSFDCSGSPGPNWPSRAEVPYKFENGKLSYLSYFDNSGYFVATSFEWVTPRKEFQIFMRHILLYMSATYNVRYVKIK